jgi:CubicO group peptidase (beta-lactamase class C family)
MSRTTIATLVAAVLVAALAAVGSAPRASATSPIPAQLGELLTRIYRGEDGGALYLRQIGPKVYGFGEHPGLGYAYVLVGTMSGDRITGSWWDVPKGTRAQTGPLELRWSQAGARIVRSGGADLGPDVFQEISPDAVPWPVMQAAGFQSTTPAKLDGAFVGDDASRHYVRETPTDAVWVAERAAQPDERPRWVTVFAGKRTSGGGLTGTYVDVPKGLERRSGSFLAAPKGATRELRLRQFGTAGRTHSLAPDYRIDWDLFASTIAQKLDGHVVGYAYAIAHNGAILRSGAGGARQTRSDGVRLPFTTHTQAQTASAAKMISAAAMIKALHDRGLTVDAKVLPFLPSCIDTSHAKDIDTLTFRQLLNHTSGLDGGKNDGEETSCNGTDPYECLLKILKEGRTHDRGYDYNNKAYDLVRLLVPLVSDTTRVKMLFGSFHCKNAGGILHRKVSRQFIRYLDEEILAPAGSEATFAPTGDFSLNYNCQAASTTGPCHPTYKGEGPRSDYFERSGSGKMFITVLDYVRWLSALDRGLILPRSLVDEMKGTPGDRLGFDTRFVGRAGEYHWKNGGCPSFSHGGDWDRSCKTIAMVFPGDVQVYVAVNSNNNTYTGAWDRQSPSEYHAGLDGLAAGAFDVALK